MTILAELRSTIDSLELVEIIKNLLGEQPGEIVSPGQVVKAMILNGLGLVSAPLYLFSKLKTLMASLKWLSRVPAKIKQAKSLM